MSGSDLPSHRAGKVLRWFVRGLSTFAAGAWLFILAASFLTDSAPWGDPEASTLGVLVLLSAVGVGVGWRSERRGGVWLTVVGAAFCVFSYLAAGRNRGALCSSRAFRSSWQDFSTS